MAKPPFSDKKDDQRLAKPLGPPPPITSTDAPSGMKPPSNNPVSKPPAGMNPAKLDWLDANAGKSAANSNRRTAQQARLDAIRRRAARS